MESVKIIVEKYNGDFEMVHKNNNEVISHVMLLDRENSN